MFMKPKLALAVWFNFVCLKILQQISCFSDCLFNCGWWLLAFDIYHYIVSSSQVALKLSTSPSRLQISAQFIGVPEIALSTKCLAKVKVITSCIDLCCVVVWKTQTAWFVYGITRCIDLCCVVVWKTQTAWFLCGI